MEWDNPFSFKGRIGRLEFFLVLLGAQVISVFLPFLPVSIHEFSRRTKFSQISFGYVTPVEPFTLLNWMAFVAYYALVSALVWAAMAALVKRQRDLGRDTKWIFYFLAAFVANPLISAAWPHPKSGVSWFDIADFIFFFPLVLLAAGGWLQLLFLPGVPVSLPAEKRFSGDI